MSQGNRAIRGAGGVGALAGIAAVGTVLAVVFLRGGGESQAALDDDRIVEVRALDVIDGVTATGRVEPVARVAVMSRASGIIEALLADVGDEVQAGQVLVQLDKEQLTAQHAQDVADVAAASARIEAALAHVAEARVRIEDPEPEFLEREAKRLAMLEAEGGTSVSVKDNAERAWAAAKFRVRMVEAGLPALEAAVSESRAGLAAAEASLERSATALREATIRSPITGVVLTRDKEVGDGVSSILTAGGNATQIMVLGDLSRMHVEARVDEVDLGRIHDAMPAIITVDAHRGRELVGTIERIAPAGSVDNNGIVTFEVRVSVEDPEGLLRPDMTADAKLVVERRDGVPALQQIAFQALPSEDPAAPPRWSALRVVGDTVEEVQVELGLSDGLMTEVLSGLSVGDRVQLPIQLRR